jgi:predicted flap endonuclease-1-like 5' DNA nuclease
VFDFILKMLFCLLLAAAIGFVVAWLLRGLGLTALKERIAQLARNLAERDATIHDRDTKIKEVRSTLAARDSTIQAHETRLGTLDSQLLHVSQQRDSVSLDLAHRDSTIKARDASVASLAALLATRDSSLGELQGSLASKEKSFLELQTAHQTATTELQRQLAEQQKVLTDRETMLRVRDETLKSREAKIEDLERNSATLAGKFAVERDQLNVKLANLENGQSNAGKAKDAEIAKLTAQLAPLIALPALIAQRESQLAAARNEANAARNDMQAYKTKLDQASGDLKTRADQNNQFNIEFEATKRTLLNRSQLLTEAQTRIQSFEQTANSTKDRLAKLETELKSCAENRRALEEEVAAFKLADKERSTKPPRQFTHAPAMMDDIKHIYGVGPTLEAMLNKLGIYLFKQVALWDNDDIDFFDAQLHEFHGRIRRENWVRSATEEHYKKYGEWLGAGKPEITMPETDRN